MFSPNITMSLHLFTFSQRIDTDANYICNCQWRQYSIRIATFLYCNKNKMPHVNLCEEDFRITDLNFSNLPRAPKLHARDDNIQKIVYDIIHGTVAAGTHMQWGIEFGTRAEARDRDRAFHRERYSVNDEDHVNDEDDDNDVSVNDDIDVGDDDDPVLLGTEDSEFFKILNIIEEKPGNDAGVYRLTYIFLQNDSPDLLTDKQLLELNEVRHLLLMHPEMQKIRNALVKTKKKMIAESIQFNTLQSFMQVFDGMCRMPGKQSEVSFASLLLFCENCEDDTMTMACQFGFINTFFLHLPMEAREILKKFQESPELSQADVGRLTQLIANKSQQPLPEDEIQNTIDEIQKWKLRNPKVQLLHRQIHRYFFPFVDIPHFDWVGNLEVFSHESSSHRSLMQIKAKLKEDLDVQSIVRNSSCTLLMALTMMQLRSQGCKIMELCNAGKIRGCMCYSNAASANEMMSIMGSSKEGLKELLDCRNPEHEFTVFNRNDCLGNEFFKFSGHMYFIDIPSAVCLFTKRKEKLGAVDVGAVDVGAVGVGAVGVGAADVGAADVGAADVGAADVGAVDVGAVDVGAVDVGAVDVGAVVVVDVDDEDKKDKKDNSLDDDEYGFEYNFEDDVDNDENEFVQIRRRRERQQRVEQQREREREREREIERKVERRIKEREEAREREREKARGGERNEDEEAREREEHEDHRHNRERKRRRSIVQESDLEHDRDETVSQKEHAEDDGPMSNEMIMELLRESGFSDDRLRKYDAYMKEAKLRKKENHQM